LRLLFLLSVASFAAAATRQPTVLVLPVRQAIGPASADFLHRNLERAASEDVALVVIELDTPGGLDESMRDIIHDIVASPVPVAVYVAPTGARAASAGTYITYAAHIAAMAPGTNIGAATPVSLGETPKFKPASDSDEDKAGKKSKAKQSANEEDKGEVPANAMGRKVVNDAVAYLRSLAQMRGRNAEWPEKAVRDGASLAANEALSMHVIDLMAPDLRSLLTDVDGRTVEVNGRPLTLDLKDPVIETVQPDWRDELLTIITNPNIAYMLMLLGFYGLFFELANPGYVLPGVVGAISLLLALYALNVLPVNYAGLALILVGVSFMIAEAFVPSFGALGIGGVTAFVIGSFILFDVGVEGFRVSVPLIGGFALLSALFFIGVAGMAINIHRRKSVTGVEALIGSLGEVVDAFEGVGRVRVQGEIWQAHSPAALAKGQTVRVTALNDLVLNVEKINEEK
jgi:membrane-bound serine protease (ClpP class)